LSACYCNGSAIANDLLTATLSGPVARFHYRIFFLLGVPAAMFIWQLPPLDRQLWARWRQRA
jgi:hypothetical protein